MVKGDLGLFLLYHQLLSLLSLLFCFGIRIISLTDLFPFLSFAVQVRTRLFGWKEAQYTNYTCYSGLTELVPAYNSTVGYAYAHEILVVHQIIFLVQCLLRIHCIMIHILSLFACQGIGCFWAIVSTLLLLMLELGRCSGMHSTGNLPETLILLQVC